MLECARRRREKHERTDFRGTNTVLLDGIMLLSIGESRRLGVSLHAIKQIDMA
jgi:hypothetical protein